MIRWWGAVGVSLLFFGALPALEQNPWYGNMLEFEVQPSCTYRSYSSIDTIAGSIGFSSDDKLLGLAVGTAVTQRWHVETEMLLASTRVNSTSLAHVAAQVRYLWLHDVIGDPATVTTGLTVIAPTSSSRRDLSLCYHGDVGIEGHLAVGKELACEGLWLARGWIMGAAGIGNEGSPWVHSKMQIESNHCYYHQFALWIEGSMGLGDKDLNLALPFQGYQDIGYSTGDVGVSYLYVIDYFGDLSASYSYRFAATNSPEKVHGVTIALRYPFSL